MNKITEIFVHCIVLILLTTPLNGQEKIKATDPINKIDHYLNEGISNGFSGFVLIAKEDQVLLNKGYGMADKENKITYNENTIATVGSVTKQFTATAIMKLVELKKLHLTDQISKFFMNLPEDKKAITVHQLLTHSGGLIDGIGEGDFEDIPRNIFFKTLFSTTLLHPPGTKHRYSNAGYSILARIIEIVSGQEYESFLNEYLFFPAGMDQTGYLIPKWESQLLAKGYVYSFFNIGTMIERYQKMGKITWTLKGNGGIHSTPNDMYKWYQALASNKILSKFSFEKLTTPYVLEHEGGTSHYAYGWAIFNSDRNTKIISHNGGNGAFFHDFIWIPEEAILIILFTNAGSKEAEVAWSIEKMFSNKDYEGDPIKKDLHFLVFDFIKKNHLKQVNKLSSIIKNEYHSTIKNSDYLNGLGYDLLREEIGLSEDNVEWAIEIFKLNVELFPKDGNIWDSLGEGYLKNGQKEEAMQSYQKALALAPKTDCAWCKGSAKAIKKLKNME